MQHNKRYFVQFGVIPDRAVQWWNHHTLLQAQLGGYLAKVIHIISLEEQRTSNRRVVSETEGSLYSGQELH